MRDRKAPKLFEKNMHGSVRLEWPYPNIFSPIKAVRYLRNERDAF